MKLCLCIILAGILLYSSITKGQTPRIVLFETFTNSYISECPQNDAFDAAFKATLAANGSKIIHLNYHIIEPSDPMALASIPSSDSVIMLLSGLSAQPFPILCGAVDRVNFPQYHKLTGTIPGGKTQWDDQIAADLKLTAPVSISFASAEIDTISSSKSSRLIANIDVTSSQAITDIMGLHFAVTQDNVPYAQCPAVPGPAIHNNVVRYITQGDSLLALDGKPPGSVIHVKYMLDISKTKANFSLKDMKLIGFVEDHTPSDFTVVQAALLRSNFATLPAPPAALSLNTANFEGKTFAPQDPVPIFFDKTSIVNVKMEYSLDNGASWNLIDTTHESFYYWTAPDANTTQAKIRISEAKTGTPISTEQGTFSIKNDKPNISIIHPTSINPTSLDTAISGKTFTIVWNSFKADTVKLSYSIDGGLHWGIIKPSVVGVKSFNWNLLGIKPVQDAEIKIEGLGEASAVVATSDPFPIISQAGVHNNNAEGSFNLSVNPQPLHKNNQLTVNIRLDRSSKIDILLYDLNGKKIISHEGNYFNSGAYAVKLDLQQLPSGTYLLEARGNDGDSRMVKVVIE